MRFSQCFGLPVGQPALDFVGRLGSSAPTASCRIRTIPSGKRLRSNLDPPGPSAVKEGSAETAWAGSPCLRQARAAAQRYFVTP